MKENKNANLQKFASFGLAGAILLFGGYEYFSGSDSEKKFGDVAKDPVSVFDQLRTSEDVVIKRDPLVEGPLPEQAPLPAVPREPDAEKNSSLPAAKEPETPAPKPKEISCSEQDWRMGLCDRPGYTPPPTRNENVSLASVSSTVAPRTLSGGSQVRREPTEAPAPPNYAASSPSSGGGGDMWGQISSSGVQSIKGGTPDYVGPVIKAHCRVLAVIVDAVRVSDNDNAPETITLRVKGPMPACNLPKIPGGLTLGGKATMSADRKGVRGNIHLCTDPDPSRPSRSCKGAIESITGEDFLEGQIYDESMFGIVLEFGINTLGFFAMKDLIGSASKIESIWEAATNAEIQKNFQTMVAKGAAKVNEAWSGRSIKIAKDAPVIVTFQEDAAL